MKYKKKRKVDYTTKLLPKVYKSVSIPVGIQQELIKLQAFTGDYQYFTHFSQYPYLLGFKNEYSFYDINKSIVLFINALRFLHSISKKPNITLVFSGTPFGDDNVSILDFKKIKQTYKFFPNERWSPGFISKNYEKTNFVLIVYDVELNNTAYKEGLNANIPIVGFVTPSNDIRGIDYPILFNLKNHQQWYVKLLLSIFYKS